MLTKTWIGAGIMGLLFLQTVAAAGRRVRDLGVAIGVMRPGTFNAITDVAGVLVGHCTRIDGDGVRTGVTVVLPHGNNLFQNKVPAAVYVGNGFGKLTGSTQVEELGNLETPIALTNTLAVPTAMAALIEYTLSLPGNEEVRSVNPLVGETNDGFLNDIRGRALEKRHVLEALKAASGGPVAEGNVGAGTGTVCFGFKGGIGTASRVLPPACGGYTVGVLVQTNFGGVLQVAGVPVGVELGRYYLQEDLASAADGSCMIVVATDAPLTSRNLERLAKRAMLGLGRTGGIAANGSGDYAIAFSTCEKLRIPSVSTERTERWEEVRNDLMSPLFLAVIEATEEAILNSLFAAESMKGFSGHSVDALPVKRVLDILRRYGRLPAPQKSKLREH